MSQCEAVLFDAGTTLIRVKPSVAVIYVRVAAWYGVGVGTEAVDRAFHALWEARRDTLRLGTSEEIERRWWHDLVWDVFGLVGKREAFGGAFDEFFGELYRLFAMPEVWHVHDDVAPTLDALEKCGLRRAVVSNWDSRLPVLFERLGLLSRFEFALTSACAGYRKPDPRIFETALARLELPKDRVVHVGDSYEEDYEGARKAGLTPILIDRDGCRPETAHTIHALTELVPWLEHHGRTPSATSSGTGGIRQAP